MKCNSCVTVYHQNGLDVATHFEKWDRYNYGDDKTPKVWFYGGIGASIDKGYDNANDFDCRIPYEENLGLNVANFSIGDIVVEGCLDFDIEKQTDLKDYTIFNITSIKNNKTGQCKHIHLGGK